MQIFLQILNIIEIYSKNLENESNSPDVSQSNFVIYVRGKQVDWTSHALDFVVKNAPDVVEYPSDPVQIPIPPQSAIKSRFAVGPELVEPAAGFSYTIALPPCEGTKRVAVLLESGHERQPQSVQDERGLTDELYTARQESRDACGSC